MRVARLRWYGHVLRREGGSVAETALTLEVKVIRPRGRPETRLLDSVNSRIDSVKSDMTEVQLTAGYANGWNKWWRRCSTANLDKR
ncbi:hypothetical protein Y032_0295g1661 [Ancylostoma ceylanicum]|nr:hypothetical protein Y032_0295g1661 [Ancylostoma ceylanicum]